MKRILSVLLLVALMLTGCGTANTEQTESMPPVTLPATEPATEPEVEVATEPELLYRHPLNGSALEQPWSGRVVAVVIPNNQAAYPHHGVSSADLLYEIEAEGSVTRCLGVFTSWEDIVKVGPVRSARTYFNSVAVSYNAPIVHCGGSPYGRTGHYDSGADTISNWNHIDEMYNGSYFLRDSHRYRNLNYAWEYTLFTNGQKLLAALKNRGYALEEQREYGLSFDENSNLTGGETANSINVRFRGGKTTQLNYNSVSGYEMIQHGSVYVDANNGEKVLFRNALLLKTDQWYDSSGYRVFYNLVGSGTGYWACDGQIVPITWERKSLRENFTYRLADGTPVVLAEGRTYVAITAQKGTVTYE